MRFCALYHAKKVIGGGEHSGIWRCMLCADHSLPQVGQCLLHGLVGVTALGGGVGFLCELPVQAVRPKEGEVHEDLLCSS